MNDSVVRQSERRRHVRHVPRQMIGVSRAAPVLPLGDVQVLNVSAQGVAIRTRVPVSAGERLSFRVGPDWPPILAVVLACEAMDQETYRIRCRCLLGGFDAQAG